MDSESLQAQHQAPEDQLPSDITVIGRQGVQGQGPFMTMQLQVTGEQVTGATFDTYGCPVAIACGNWVTGWVKGKSLEIASRMQPGDLMVVMGGLPLGKEHCAQLAVGALQEALRQIAGAAGPGGI